METRGVIMYNRGDRMIVRILVALYSLRKYYSGDITFYLESPCSCPVELENAIKYFGCHVVRVDERHDLKVLVRKSLLLEDSPYDYTLWIDSDTVTVAPIDDMFNYLIDNNADLCIPWFCNWVSTGPQISKRIKRLDGLAKDRHMKEALKEHPAINTGVLSFRRSPKWKEFMSYVTEIARLASEKRVFIPDETSAQVHYPSMHEWGLKYFICDPGFNYSVLFGRNTKSIPRIHHMHGDKHCLPDRGDCYIWTDVFEEMCSKNIANINSFLKYADKRLVQYLKRKSGMVEAVTIVTAADPYYIELLRVVWQNWIKYKNIDKYPVIVFINGMDINTDPKLDFLRLPNVTMIKWDEMCMDKVESQRELMLSAFVFGAAMYVKTEYWMKLDADSYAVNSKPLVFDEMKKFAFCGAKWGYSRPSHIKLLDEWAKGHWKRKLRTAKPMINEGKTEGNRFYHNFKRTISFIQLHKTKFTRFAVKLLKTRRLPCPSQDTFFMYVCQRFDPQFLGAMNLKKLCGFTQGRGKLGAEHIKKCVEEVDRINNAKNNSLNNLNNSSDSEMSDYVGE